MLETAMTAGVFFMIIFLGCEMLRLGFNLIMTQYVTSTIIREAVIGNVAKNMDSNYTVITNPEARAQVMEDLLLDRAAELGLNLGPKSDNNTSINICALGADCTKDDNAGTSDELLSVQVRYTLPMFFGLGSYEINVTMLGKNEPFDAFKK